KVYGDPDTAFTFTVSGWKYNDSVNSANIIKGALNRVSGDSVGTYAITVGTLSDTSGNYTINFTEKVPFKITKAPLTVTPDSGQTKVYGQDDSAFTFTIAGWKSGDEKDSANIITGALSRVSGDSVGTYAITQGTLSDTSGNYTINFTENVPFKITKAPLTVTPYGGQTKVYGEDDPVFTFTTAGWRYSDDTTLLTGALSRDADSSVGTYAIILGTLSDTSGNYDIEFAADTTFEITKAPLTVTPNGGQKKVYGQNDPTFTFAVSGWQYGDSVASASIITGALGRDTGRNVGTYAITKGNLSDTSGNYDITFAAGATFAITKATLTVTPNSGQSKVYGDGEPAAFTFAVSGWQYNDSVNSASIITGALSRDTGEVTGHYAITKGNLPDTSKNYTIDFDSTVTFAIAKASLTVKPFSNQSKVYGDGDSTFAFTVSGWKNGDDENSASIKGKLDRAPGEDVGEYVIIPGNLQVASYTINFIGGVLFAITPAPLTVTPYSGQTKVYGNDDPAFMFAVSGWQRNDVDSTNIITGALSRVAGDSVGTYDIMQGDFSAGSNYTVNFIKNVPFEITPAELTVTPDSGQKKVYGQNDSAFTFTTAGWQYEDSVNSASIITGALTRVLGDSVGTYAITNDSLSAGSNYTVNFIENVPFEITPAELTVTPDSGQTKVYGDDDPAFTFAVSGWQRNDVDSTNIITGALSRVAGDSVGTYDITKGGFSAGSNYTVNFIENVPFEITKALLTVTPDSGQAKVYGKADPVFTFAVSGWRHGDKMDSANIIAGAVIRVLGDSVGTYDIMLGNLSAGSNYNVNFIENVPFEITKALLTVTPDSGQAKVYGEADPAFTFTVSGWLHGEQSDSASIITGALSRDTGNNVGEYAITSGTLRADNYAINFAAGVPFTIIPSPQEISFAPIESLLVENNFYLLTATVSTPGGAPALPPLFRSSNKDVAEVSGDTLWLKQQGTVTVTAYVAPNSNYKDADTVSHTVSLRTNFLDFDTYVAVNLRCIMVYNNRLLSEHGYTVKAFRWYGNGQLLATGSFYALDAAWMAFTSDVVYHFEMDTPEGTTIRSTNKIFDFSTAVGGVEGKNRLLLYPNPLPQGVALNVHAGAWGAGARELLIYSAAGNLVLRKRFSGEFITLPVAAPAGVYFLRVGSSYGKIVIID
ncbi:MAG: hypothetical protein LBL94_02165, partial [Prevotellaceae bacterium]|nr:hypothetical protein [Prevotellaceae bacterium]